MTPFVAAPRTPLLVFIPIMAMLAVVSAFAAHYVSRAGLEKTVIHRVIPQNGVQADDSAEWRFGAFLANVNGSLSVDEARRIGEAISRYGREHNLSPGLIAAVIMVESSGRLNAVSPKGAVGLMQVMPFWSKEFGIEARSLLEIETNIKYGSLILSNYIKKWGLKGGLIRYWGGSGPGGERYIKKVMSAMEEIAAAG